MYRWSKKALVCGNCNARSASRVVLRSVGRAEGAIPRSVHEPTKRHKHPGCSASVPLRGGAGERVASVVAGAVGLGSSPEPPGRRRQVGARAHASRRGARNPSGGAAAKSSVRFPAPCPSLGGARPMLPGSARNRAPSLHRGGRHRTYRPRRESGDAPARGTRRGSTEGMAPRRHLTALTGRARSSHEARARLVPVPKDPRTGTRGDALLEGCPRERDYRSGVPRAAGNRRRGERGRRRQPRAEEDSRLAGVPARRTCVAEIGSAVVAQRSRRFNSPPRADGAPAVGVGSVVGEHLGRRRKMPARALATTNDCPSDPFVNVSRRPRVARLETGSTERSVARASYRRKAPRIVPSRRSFTGAA